MVGRDFAKLLAQKERGLVKQGREFVENLLPVIDVDRAGLVETEQVLGKAASDRPHRVAVDTSCPACAPRNDSPSRARTHFRRPSRRFRDRDRCGGRIPQATCRGTTGALCRTLDTPT